MSRFLYFCGTVGSSCWRFPYRTGSFFSSLLCFFLSLSHPAFPPPDVWLLFHISVPPAQLLSLLPYLLWPRKKGMMTQTSIQNQNPFFPPFIDYISELLIHVSFCHPLTPRLTCVCPTTTSQWQGSIKTFFIDVWAGLWTSNPHQIYIMAKKRCRELKKQMFSDANITAGTTERDKGRNVKQHFTRKKPQISLER